MASSCVRVAAIHPFHQHQTIKKTKHMLLSSPTYVQANLTSSLIRDLRTSLNFLLVGGQNHSLQFLSLTTPQYPKVFTSKRRTICMATLLCENTTSIENTPKIPATEICIPVFVYIIPFINRLNLLSKFPVLKYAMSPIMPLLGFYQSVSTLGLIVFLAITIGFTRYRNFTKFYSLQAIVMDCVVVIASLVRPFIVNPNPLAAALGFKFQLLNVLELLGFQTCILSCLEYLGAIQWFGEQEMQNVNEEEVEKVNEEEEEKVSVTSDSFIDTLCHMIDVVLKTEKYNGRRAGKSLVLKLLRGNDSLLHSEMNSTETCNKSILSSCQRCLNSLLNLFKKAAKNEYHKSYELSKQISLEADNILSLLDILEDRQAAEEFTLMWANQQDLANLHTKFHLDSLHHISCITTRLFADIGNGKIHPAKNIRHLLLHTWFQPLVDDYPSLRKLKSFDQKAVEENIERGMLELVKDTIVMAVKDSQRNQQSDRVIS